MKTDLAEWLPKQRWFRAKSHRVHGVTVVDSVPLDNDLALHLLDVAHDGGHDDYVMLVDPSAPDTDVLGAPATAERLLKCFGGPVRAGQRTTVRFDRMPGVVLPSLAPPAKPVSTEQTNSSIVYGDQLVLKILRKLDEGLSPDMEMGEFLTLAGYRHAPALVGTIVVDRPNKQPSTLGVLHRFVANRGDAWTWAIEALKAGTDILPRIELLGRRVGEMHTALASRTDLPSFAPEHISRSRREAMVTAARGMLDRALAKAGRKADLASIHARLERFVLMTNDPIATRVHGDLHLGQVLFTGDDFVLIDFEGEPARPLAHRRAKRPAFADVAGMIRSFHYAAVTAGKREWFAPARVAFMRGWNTSARAPDNADTILDYCILEKCIYEVQYEADNRPDWVDIPLEGLTA